LGAIAAHPELRTKISDSHVAAGAQALLRRRYPVAYLRRGTRDSVIEELKDAVASGFDIDRNSLPGGVSDILTVAKAKAGDIPFLLLIDTAMERGSRVTRDDGPLLAEIADAIKTMNAFVGVALDDDIAGADGTNSAIVRSFTIDYLDQEHLYKVVDTYVFPKNNQMRPVLHDVYEYFREVMPTFRWSEQKFSALYPLHPAILEVAPFVRLYVHGFALLGFASDAGERILGRPANSLIALDEVFDSAEQELRKIEDLKDAFAAYDRLNSDVVAKIPVMQRLQAKLILKALLLLSLEGQGTTAGEISSGMLIFDENDPQKAARTVEELIRMFAAALPEDVRVYSEEGREVRYGLKVSSKDKLNKALDAAAGSIDRKTVNDVLQRLLHERFSDSTFFALDGSRKDLMECQLSWRGGLRRGRVSWVDKNSKPSVEDPSGDNLHDWEVMIDLSEGDAKTDTVLNDIPRVIWKPAELKRDEIDAILRFQVLATDTAFREEYGEQIRASLHSHTVILDRILNRVFLEDGRLVIDNFDYNFTEEARVAPSFGEMFSLMLEPLFEVRYPQHPYFLNRLGLAEVSSLVSDLYSGSRQQLREVQQLAHTFALPLGLVKLTDSVYLPAGEQTLSELESVRSIASLVDGGGKNGATLNSIYAELKKPPYGLVREAQQLVMAAMVSQRMIEFVTSKGDRINQRSLDLKIIWDDIVGLARPQETSYSAKKLVKWATAFSGGKDFKNLDTEKKLIQEALGEWLQNWDSASVLSAFSLLPPESINTKVWRMAGRSTNTLGSAAGSIRNFITDSISLEECLGRISDAFLDEPDHLHRANEELLIVDSYVRGFEQRRKVLTYVTIAEPTDNKEVETCRETLLYALEHFDAGPSDSNAREIGYLWTKFQREFSEHFVSQHDSVMKSHHLQSQVSDLLRSDAWWEFENLVDSVGSNIREVSDVLRRRKRLGELNCSGDTAENLKTQPYCNCSYSLNLHSSWETIADDFQQSLSIALDIVRGSIIERASELIPAIDAIDKEGSGENSNNASPITTALRSNAFPAKLDASQIHLLKAALKLLEPNYSKNGQQEDLLEDDRSTSPRRTALPEIMVSENVAVVS